MPQPVRHHQAIAVRRMPPPPSRRRRHPRRPWARAPRRLPAPSGRGRRSGAATWATIDGATRTPRVHVHEGREAAHRAEAGPRAARGRVAVAKALLHARHAGALVERQQLERRPARQRAHERSPPPACLTRFVPSSLTRRPASPAAPRRARPARPAPQRGDAPLRPDCGRRSGKGADRCMLSHTQRAMRTRVPCPGVEEMSNSLDSRLAPPRPRPRPEPVV